MILNEWIPGHTCKHICQQHVIISEQLVESRKHYLLAELGHQIAFLNDMIQNCNQTSNGNLRLPWCASFLLSDEHKDQGNTSLPFFRLCELMWNWLMSAQLSPLKWHLVHCLNSKQHFTLEGFFNWWLCSLPILLSFHYLWFCDLSCLFANLILIWIINLLKAIKQMVPFVTSMGTQARI